MSYDYGHEKQTVVLKLVILGAMKLEIDCKSSWGPPAMDWNQQRSLIRPRMQKTVLSFLGFF